MMAGIIGATYWVLCPIILLCIGSASAQFQRGICPPGKDGLLPERPKHVLVHKSTPSLLGQSQELRCDYRAAFQFPSPFGNHDLLSGLKLVWFKEKELVSNSSDGRVTITQDVVIVPDNISHLCLSQFPKNFVSTLSIHNIEKSDYGVYNCYLVINSEFEATSNMKLIEEIHLTTHKGPDDTAWPTALYPKLSNKCKTTLTCEVLCFDCCPCDTGLCEMMLLKNNKMVTSTTSITANGHTFKASLKVSIDGVEDFGDYHCKLKQLVIDCIDGSMMEDFRMGKSLHLGRPEVIYLKPSAWRIDAVVVQFSCRATWITSERANLKSWDVVLTKDGKEVASNTLSLDRMPVLEESFTLNKTVQDVYGRYQCIMRRKDHGCMDQSWFSEPRMHSKTYVDLEPYTVIWRQKDGKGRLKTAKFNYTCGFLVERGGSEDNYKVAVILDDKEVFRVDGKTQSTADENVDVVFGEIEIEVKDPTSYGVYNCFLEKNGLPYPNAEHMKDGEEQIRNTFQIIHPWKDLPQNVTINTSLGSTIYLACGVQGILDADIKAHVSFHHNSEKIKDGDNNIALLSQRFRVSGNIVSFLWATIMIENLEVFGTYECRCKDSMEANESVVTLHNFFIEARNWAEQALEFHNGRKEMYNGVLTISRIHNDHLQKSWEVLTALNQVLEIGKAWRSYAILGWMLLLLLVACCIIRLYYFAKRKWVEMLYKNALDKIHQMNAFGGPIEGSHQYTYDVFISYSSEDACWVRYDLLHHLENDFGYTVCLDERDFIAGEQILTSIANAIYQSRKLIVVMSKNFIKSGWCRHELALTYHRRLDQRENCVVFVKYDDCTIPRGLAMHSYLDWTDDEPIARDRFWANLHKQLGFSCN